MGKGAQLAPPCLHPRRHCDDDDERTARVRGTVEDREGRVYTGRITGKEIASDDNNVTVYVTTDERVLVYDGGRLAYWQVEAPEIELRELLPNGAYAAAMEELGLKAVIDL